MGTPNQIGASPGGSGSRGAVLIGAALFLGIVLLNQFDTGPAPFSEEVETGSPATTRRPGVTVSQGTTTTTRPLRPPAEVKVLPANGAGVLGLGGRTGEYLRINGYNALAAVDATRPLDQTRVEFTPEFEGEARQLALLLSLPPTAVVPLEEAPPVPDTRGADIIVIIGADFRLPEAGATTTTSTTRRP